MKKIGLGLIILAFSLSFSGSAPLPVLHAQAAPENDLSACHRPVRIFPVGHTTAHINVLGTLGENRPVDVGLWYPARFLHHCDRSEVRISVFGRDQWETFL